MINLRKLKKYIREDFSIKVVTAEHDPPEFIKQSDDYFLVRQYELNL